MAFLPFSAQARPWESVALALRRLAGTRDGELLDPQDLAGKVGLCLIDADFALEGFCEADKRHLLVTARDHWSGGVLPVPLPDGRCICILNPKHHRRRNRVTLMEEIVHKYRNHVPTGLREVMPGLRTRTYNHAHEAEAYGVGAAMLLSWSTFYHDLDAGTPIADIAEAYDVSTQLVEYRIKITGATNLYRNRCRASQMVGISFYAALRLRGSNMCTGLAVSRRIVQVRLCHET